MSDRYVQRLERENTKLRSAVRTLVDDDEAEVDQWDPVDLDDFEDEDDDLAEDDSGIPPDEDE